MGHPTVTFVLGAGASRGAKHGNLGRIPSPLDSDFFDLLQRLKSNKKDEAAVNYVLEKVATLPWDYRRSFERSFYTLHQQAYLRRCLDGGTESGEEERKVVSNFARAVQALLREAHPKAAGSHHCELFRDLGRRDAILTFNYDLVAEQALTGPKGVPCGDWVYCFKGTKRYPCDFPKILKLHGSSNWLIKEKEGELYTREMTWKGLGKKPKYFRYSVERTTFPIFLPFWEKRVEDGAWLHLWQQAAKQLLKTRILLVWGYSLSPIDIKSRELFNISIPNRGKGRNLCVVDPSKETRQRWRELLSSALYWEYDRIQDFFDNPPPWWWGAYVR